jgi:hypothetical protein
MKRVHAHRLSDEELRAELAADDTVVFTGPDLDGEEIERQVERLGLCVFYVVTTLMNGKRSMARIRVRDLPGVRADGHHQSK